MLDKLTRYFRTQGPDAPGEPDAESPADDASARDLMVEGAVAPALREVFAQERSRTAAGQVITLYDPQRAFTPILPRLIEATGGTPGDRIRLVEARSRRALALIDRALLSTGGSVLRLLEVDIACADRPSRDVPLTLLEQSDVGVVLLGAAPDPALLEALVTASLEPTWRCSTLILAVPRDAPLALARLSKYTWPAGTRTEPLIDAATDLPRLLTSVLRRAAPAPASCPAAEAASHVDRISQMLASVAAPVAAKPPAEATVLDTAPVGAVARPPADAEAEATVPAALMDLDDIAQLVQEPAEQAPSPAPAMRPDPDRSLPPLPSLPSQAPRSARAAPEPAAPSRAAPHEPALAALEPLMRLPGAIAAAIIDLRDARLGAQLGATGALAAAQPAVLLGCRPLALAADRLDRVSEWAWVAGGRQHVLQPLAADPLSALLMVLDSERCDLAMTRWSCTVARNGIDHNVATLPARAMP